MAKNQSKKTAKSCQKMAKNCRKRPKIVENGQNQTGIKLILPGKTEPEVHQLTPSKMAPLTPPFPPALNVKHQLHFQNPKKISAVKSFQCFPSSYKLTSLVLTSILKNEVRICPPSPLLNTQWQVLLDFVQKL